MNKLVIFFCTLGIRVYAQLPVEGLPFELSPLTFNQVASSMNTLNKAGAPLEFLQGITLDIGQLAEPPYPVEVSFVVDESIDHKSLELLRWDGSLRRWMTFSGNGLSNMMSGVEGTVAFMLRKEGSYGLFRDANYSNKVEITLPKNHRCEHYRYVQTNTGVVLEGKAEGDKITLHIDDPSPRAQFTMKCKDEDRALYVLQAPFGKVCPLTSTHALYREFNYQLKAKEVKLLAVR
jgi:hypothetical protein